MKRSKSVVSVMGWVGAATTLTAYALNSHGIIQSASPAYLFLNAAASSMLLIYTHSKGAYANAAINVIWLIVTVLAAVFLLQN